MSDQEVVHTGTVRDLHALADLVTPMAVRTFVSLGLPDHLSTRPSTAGELAAAFDCDPRILAGILAHLAARGVVRGGPDGRYGLTELGRAACTADDPHSPQAWLVQTLRRGTIHGDVNFGVTALLETVRSGRTAFEEEYGESLWDRVERMSMDEVRAGFGPQAPVVDFEPVQRIFEEHDKAVVCDVGCGNGKLVRELLTRKLCAHCYLVDRAPMLDLAGELLADLGGDRYTLSEADFMTDVLPAADLYVLCDVLADWDDESAIRLLRNIRRSCSDGAHVLVTELTIPAGAGDIFDHTAGRLRLDIEMARPNRTIEEIVELGRGAELESISTTSGPHRVAVLFEAFTPTGSPDS